MTRYKLKRRYNLDRTAINFENYKKQCNICVILSPKSAKQYFNNIDIKNVTNNRKFQKTESAKLHALHAKNMLICQHALCAYMLMCQRALCALRAHVPTCFACSCAHVPTCLEHLHASCVHISSLLMYSLMNVAFLSLTWLV